MINTKITPHPQFLERLFTRQVAVNRVFRDVLGLYEIAHISLCHINQHQELLTFSSTPSLEFNLFSTQLWRFDKTYQPSWYQLYKPSAWEALYLKPHVDQLYHLKQSKPQYPTALSIPVELPSSHIIYSIASQSNGPYTQQVFSDQQDILLRIAQYCSNLLLPLFDHSDPAVQNHRRCKLKSDNYLKCKLN